MAPAASPRTPRSGRAFDRLVSAGATCIFEETGEMIGCEGTDGGAGQLRLKVGEAIVASIAKAETLLSRHGLRQLRAGQCRGRASSLAGREIGGRVCEDRARRRSLGVIKPARDSAGGAGLVSARRGARRAAEDSAFRTFPTTRRSSRSWPAVRISRCSRRGAVRLWDRRLSPRHQSQLAIPRPIGG